MPTVTYNGGAVLAHPEVVSVSFDGDDLEGTIRDFDARAPSTAWWAAVTEGYCDHTGACVGPLTTRGHVTLPRLTAAQTAQGFVDSTTAQDSRLKSFLRDQIDAGLFPEPTDQTLLMLYFPATVSILSEGAQSCTNGGFAGYHDSMTRKADGTGARFAYAILPRCSSDGAFLQKVASHELIEAATDPFTSVIGGYIINDLLWSLLAGGEVADMCTDLGTQNDAVVEAGLTLARSWSNAAALRGANPCVPVPPGEVYFNAAPTQGSLVLANGESARIELDAFSDGQLDDWDVSAVDFLSAIGIEQPYLRLGLDRSVANNGSKVVLTITTVRPAPQSFVGAPFLVISRTRDHTHVWPGVVYGN